MSIEQHLKELNITLPEVSTPVANYVPYTISGNLVYISGQISRDASGQPAFLGKLGDTVSIVEGQTAANSCAIQIVAILKQACGGDLDKVVSCVKLGGFVNCTPEFTNQPAVINGASDVMVQIFGDKGKHARAAVGVSSLPLGVSVEVDAIFEIKK